jgi:TrmH family RNA methyltransferase
LRDKRARDAEGAYVVEGRILVGEALAAGAPVRLVLLGPDGDPPAGAERATVARHAPGGADPGNVGTIMRAAEAAGAAAVVATDGGADPFGPKAVRASGGAVFRLPIPAGGPIAATLAALAAGGRRVLGADAAGPPYDEVDLTGAVALVVGREVGGLPADAAAQLDGLVGIPMAGRADSLNAAMAATVLVVEAARQRRSAR